MRPLGPHPPRATRGFLPARLCGAGLLALSLTVVAPGAVGRAQTPAETADPHPRDAQTSDGLPGLLAPPRSASQRARPILTTIRSKWRVAPGVVARTYDESTPRGPVRGSLLVVDLDTPGLTLDYARSARLSRPEPLTAILRRDRAVAGVNGDFFDIGDTGAPLGVGQDRQQRLVHAPRSGWNSAFLLDRRGRPRIGRLPLRSVVTGHPRWKVTHVNAPEVRPGGIGVYTRAWGRTGGYRVTDGQRRHVRMVVLRRGRVVSTSPRLTRGKPIRGQLLIGRGKGARQLARLRPGRRVEIRRWLEGRPRVAITGNKFLVRDHTVEVVDDREMHPRTAIGIDRETNRLLLLVVDGRQSFSRGLTMVELAERMVALGADDALNLDGGGSSTMVARGADRGVGVINSPSDGAERPVPNGLELVYRR